MFFDQGQTQIRCEWGPEALHLLGPAAEALVIVDVLSYSTCVDIALSRGAQVLPYRWKDASAAEYAQRHGALLASPEREAGGGFSLSPRSLQRLPSGARLVLPSPNGATLCAIAAESSPARIFVAGLRNASALAPYLATCASVLVVPAGERWPDGSLRVALEDWLGAGAIIAALSGSKSPEARAAEEAFRAARPQLAQRITSCSSGRELIERGFEADVHLAAALDVSLVVAEMQRPQPGVPVLQVPGE